MSRDSADTSVETVVVNTHVVHVDAPEGLPISPSSALPARYEDLGLLGIGGMGEVRRVRDRELGRICACKVIRPDLVARTSLVERFVEEAQVGAQLQHPNIPPIYDWGVLPDGRPWFTMKEVRGRALSACIAEAHDGGAGEDDFHRLCDFFVNVCDAVGYAHQRGVIHRDLKPDNVMIGAHGEVLVMDWGLAKVRGRDRADEPIVTGRSARDAAQTRVGGVLGTPAYMPPEQARGAAGLDGRSDVYALGAILYEVLTGRPPYTGIDGVQILDKVLKGPPEPIGPGLPDDLVATCLRCMARDPEQRPADGAAVAAEVRAWLDGARKRERALQVVREADSIVAEAIDLRARAEALRAEGDALLATIPRSAPESSKAAAWATQDAAAELQQQSERLEYRREMLLRGALTHAPRLAEAHAGLIELELARHRAAEADRDTRRAAQAQLRIAEHSDALPARHPARLRAQNYLAGDGALTLHTEPPGAEVELFRYEQHNRRLVAVSRGIIGKSPLEAIPLALGSYLCVIRHRDCAPVRYPVVIGRNEHWSGVAPGERRPRPIRLPLHEELGPDDCLVPAGPFIVGGDAQASQALAQRRLWCDELVVRRFPITNGEFLTFLDDLVDRGRNEEAERHVPRERASMSEAQMVYGRDSAGHFYLRPDADGDVWQLDWPVTLVSWFGARAYAKWLAERTGVPWRLLGELEWEKAARGVDGRFYPWGDSYDPSWARGMANDPSRPIMGSIDGCPVDESPYGIRGLGGNAMTWCADVFRWDGPPVDGGRVLEPAGGDDEAPRVYRGGHWQSNARSARAAGRYRFQPTNWDEVVGFRVGYRR